MNSTRFDVIAEAPEFQWMGQLSYPHGLELQKTTEERVRSELHPGIIYGLEHESVITLGKRGTLQDLRGASSGIPVQTVDRGGQATLHHPGQLVIYPILHFKKWGFQPRTWVEFLLDVTQNTLQNLGVATKSSDGAGLETERGKIVFLGVRLHQGVSTHGLSINCCNNLSEFDFIRPCGLESRPLDSLKKQGIHLNPKDVFKVWIEEFRLLTTARDLGITRDVQAKSSLGVVGSAFP